MTPCKYSVGDILKDLHQCMASDTLDRLLGTLFLPVCLKNNALSLSSIRHQLKHFYFSSY